eukprot:CAMPEP_0115379660 /NCGR_PEP_ID=MMETSP0271-20121206/4644_1 /TAXON_ID=71861 /ORGANISM="Scrippsiella trochoidea, Strain CCMP3099" /LENGTH=122 /DNA_ID=CAMNT_0002802865 /DNA_START=252 /DNA_END=621 /DNA_ORIENTATION=-
MAAGVAAGRATGVATGVTAGATTIGRSADGRADQVPGRRRQVRGQRPAAGWTAGCGGKGATLLKAPPAPAPAPWAGFSNAFSKCGLSNAPASAWPNVSTKEKLENIHVPKENAAMMMEIRSM